MVRIIIAIAALLIWSASVPRILAQQSPATSPSSQSQSRSSQRNTQWFEDTIDDFLRTAQDGGEGTDIQISTCKISSQQLVATAQATAARVLKGVCNPSENEERFRSLEGRLDEQLTNLRSMVQRLEDNLYQQQQLIQAQYNQLLSAMSRSTYNNDYSNSPTAATAATPSPTTTTTSRITPAATAQQPTRTYTLYSPSTTNSQSTIRSYSEDQRVSSIVNPQQGHATSTTYYPQQGSSSVTYSNSYYTPRYIPSVPHRAQHVTHESEEDYNDLSFETSGSGGGGSSTGSGTGGTVTATGSSTSSRATEIQTYNSTIHIENGKRVFSYYWIVSGINNKLNSWNLKRALRSNNFYVSPQGYSMYLKIIPRYQTNTMYIHVGITKGAYDDTLEWPFTKTMRVSVLAQDPNRISASGSYDIKSRIWNPRDLCSGTNWRKPVYTDNPECVGLGFPHDNINSPIFIVNDQIVIKLTVFMD